MGVSLGRRLLNLVWGPAEDDYDMYEDEPLSHDDDHGPVSYEEELAPARPATRRGRPAPRGGEDLVELRPPQRPQTEVHYPRSFDDAQALADLFKNGSMVIIDLEQVDEKDRSRLVNFLCGVAYGRDGKSHRINDLTFVFAPRHFDLEAEAPRRDTRDAGYVPRYSPSV